MTCEAAVTNAFSAAVSTDGQAGDDPLADAVQVELRGNAATTHLPIVVLVRDGIVYLHGSVPDPVDRYRVVDVALRVPGVDEVAELLAISPLR